MFWFKKVFRQPCRKISLTTKRIFWISQPALVQLNFDFSIPLTFPLTLETWIKVDLPFWDVALEVHHLETDSIVARNSLTTDDFVLTDVSGN